MGSGRKGEGSKKSSAVNEGRGEQRLRNKSENSGGQGEGVEEGENREWGHHDPCVEALEDRLLTRCTC